jgi:hypothetical protein
MAAAIMGLIGAALGVVAVLFGSAWSDRRQARKEERCYQRDQRTAAYQGALRYLNRAANRRSELIFGPTGSRALLRGEDVRDWFDDLVEAQYWVRVLLSRCGASQTPRIRQVLDDLNIAARSLDRGTSQEAQRPTRTHDAAATPRLWRASKAIEMMPCVVIEATNPFGILPIMQVIQEALQAITKSARLDLGSEPLMDGSPQAELTRGST